MKPFDEIVIERRNWSVGEIVNESIIKDCYSASFSFFLFAQFKISSYLCINKQ